MSTPETQRDRARHALRTALTLSHIITLLQAGATTTEAYWRYVAANTQAQSLYNNVEIGMTLEVQSAPPATDEDHAA